MGRSAPIDAPQQLRGALVREQIVAEVELLNRLGRLYQAERWQRALTSLYVTVRAEYRSQLRVHTSFSRAARQRAPSSPMRLRTSQICQCDAVVLPTVSAMHAGGCVWLNDGFCRLCLQVIASEQCVARWACMGLVHSSPRARNAHVCERVCVSEASLEACVYANERTFARVCEKGHTRRENNHSAFWWQNWTNA